MKKLEGKIALVTGAGRGIGAAIAETLAAEGADVICVSRTLANAAKVAEAVSALGRKSLAVAVDVADPAQCEKAIADILAAWPQIDILVNNAGITRDGLLMRMSDQDWDLVLDTNLKGAFHFTKPLSRLMAKQRSGRIINISSVVGLVGNGGQCNYAASKAGLIGFSKSVAREMASRGVTCNAIAPGFVISDMTEQLPDAIKQKVLQGIPLGCFGEPADIAQAALYLAADSGRFVTGQVLVVDGGMTM